jgi:arylsulfatase A-like enzyme
VLNTIGRFLRDELRPALVVGLLVGFIVGLRDAVAVIGGAYDPWLTSRRLCVLYPIIEAAWWGAGFSALALLLAAARAVSRLLFGPERRDTFVSPLLLYLPLAVVGLFVALFVPDLPRVLLSSLPIPEGRVRAAFVGTCFGAAAAIILLYVSRVLRFAPRPASRDKPAGRLSLAAWLVAAVSLVVIALLTLPRGPDAAGVGEDLAERPNILLISIDALRADACSFASHAAPPTPEIDRLAARSVAFASAFAQGPSTLPSLASLMTSRYPSEVGVAPASSLPLDQSGASFYRPSESSPTLAELLRAAGYQTAAQLTNPYLTKAYGLHRGFSHHRHSQTPARKPLLYDLFAHALARAHPRLQHDDAEPLTRGAIAWLREERREPFFLWIHYLDPHAPYGPPLSSHSRMLEHDRLMPIADRPLPDPEREAARTKLRDLYHAEVAYCDHWVGRLLDCLDDLDLSHRTFVILSADHGEAFWESGALHHGGSFCRAVTHVPLLIAFPDRRAAGHVIRDPVRLLDIMPTVLEAASVQLPPGLRGRSLVELIREPRAASRPPRQLLAECCYPPPDRKALRVGSLVLTYCPADGSFQCFTDGEPPTDCPDPPPPRLAALQQRLRAWADEMDQALSQNRGELPQLSPEHERQLKALGYL